MRQKQLHLSSTLLFLFCSLIFAEKGFSQAKDSIPVKKDSVLPAKIVITGYADGYYAYYTDSVGIGNYQKFPTVSPKSNSFGLNVAHLNFQYDGKNTRAVVGLHFGDIQRSAWDGNIMEAHAGIRILKKLWLDGGFFRTHVGTEGLMPKENICSSVAVGTFMEPYFESGVRFNYVPNDKFSLNFLILNGYNIYQENNSKKSFGLLATYAFNDNLNVGYSNYIGDDSPDSDTLKPIRFFNNIFLNFQSKKIKLQIGGDYGIQKTDDPNDPALVMSTVGTFKYMFRKKAGIYVRGEYFSDAQGFLSGTYMDENNKISGLMVWGITAGLEYKPTDNSYLRLEGRQLNTEKVKMFYWDGKATNIRNEVMVNLGVSF